MSTLIALPGGAEGGEAPWTGKLVALDLVDALADSAGSYEGDVAGFIGRALPIVTAVSLRCRPRPAPFAARGCTRSPAAARSPTAGPSCASQDRD